MSGSTSDAVRRKTCYGDLHIDMEGLPQTLEFGQILRPSLGVVKIIAKFPPARASGILKLPQLAQYRKLFQFMASQIRYFIFIYLYYLYCIELVATPFAQNCNSVRNFWHCITLDHAMTKQKNIEDPKARTTLTTS